jgi:hypothetical protein
MALAPDANGDKQTWNLPISGQIILLCAREASLADRIATVQIEHQDTAGTDKIQIFLVISAQGHVQVLYRKKPENKSSFR